MVKIDGNYSKLVETIEITVKMMKIVVKWWKLLKIDKNCWNSENDKTWWKMVQMFIKLKGGKIAKYVQKQYLCYFLHEKLFLVNFWRNFVKKAGFWHPMLVVDQTLFRLT